MRRSDDQYAYDYLGFTDDVTGIQTVSIPNINSAKLTTDIDTRQNPTTDGIPGGIIFEQNPE